MEESTVVWLTTNRATTWLLRNVFSRIDPLIFKATNGRYFSMGAPTLPMLTLTTIGRRSRKPRSVHLACFEREGDHLVVASAMGQQSHPAWMHNMEANPEVEVQVRGERFAAKARALSDEEKGAIWDDVKATIPQMNVYEGRTERNIRVYRLSRVSG